MKVHKMKIKYSEQGFTLVELAVVILILGLLFSSFLTPLAARVEQEERNKTKIQLDEIKDILVGYMLANKHLPCPDCRNGTSGCGTASSATPTEVQDGEEDTIVDTATGVDRLICATSVGNLPWVTLGIKGTDEWENNFTYRVASNFADRENTSATGDSDGTGCGVSSQGVSFSLCSDGNIKILKTDDSANPTTSDSVLAGEVPAIVVSHGSNCGIAANCATPLTPPSSPSNSEEYNYGSQVTFYNNNYTQQASDTGVGGFDDLLIWISPYELKTIAVRAEILP